MPNARSETYKTLHDVVRTIEKEPAFAYLNGVFTSRYTMDYECFKV